MPKITHKEFFEALKAGKIAPCYLFTGEEEYVKQQAYEQLLDAVAGGEMGLLNRARLENPMPDALIAAAETVPFMSDKRFLEIRELPLITSEKTKDYDEDAAIAKLDAYLSRLPDTLCMVIYARGKVDGKRKLTKVLEKKATVVTFDHLDDKSLNIWIAKELKKQNKKISADTCQQLYFAVGRDLNHLLSEINKLIAYCGERPEVTAGDIKAVCTTSMEYKVFDLADLVFSGQKAKAMTMLSGLLFDGVERLSLLPLLGNQCRRLRDAKVLNARGMQAWEIAGKLGVYSSAVQRMLDLARRYRYAQLREAAQMCVDTEYLVKSGRIPDEGSLEQVIFRIFMMQGGK